MYVLYKLYTIIILYYYIYSVLFIRWVFLCSISFWKSSTSTCRSFQNSAACSSYCQTWLPFSYLL